MRVTKTGARRIRRRVPTSRRGTYLAGVGTGYAYTLAVALANLALIPIFANSLGTDGLGIWLTLVSVAQWVALASTWAGPAIVKAIGSHIARGEPDEAAALIANTRIVYGAVSAVVALLALLLATQDALAPLGGALTSDIRATILLTAAWSALLLQSQVHLNVLLAAQRLYVANAIQVMVIAASALLSIAALLAGFGLAAVAASYVLGAGAGLLALSLASRRVLPIPSGTQRPSWYAVRAIFTSAAPYSLSGVAWILMSADIVIVALLQGPDQAARYGTAYKLTEALLQLVWRVSDATQPYLVEAEALGEFRHVAAIYRTTVGASVLLGGSIAVTLFFLGEKALVVWVGEQNTVSELIVRIMCVYVFLQSFVHANLVYPFVTARMTRIARVQLGEGVLKIVLSAILGGAIGLAGVPISSVIAIALVSAWYIPAFTMRCLNVSIRTLGTEVASMGILVPLFTGAAAWSASWLFAEDSIAALSMSAAITVLGSLTGAVMTFALIRRRASLARVRESRLC